MSAHSRLKQWGRWLHDYKVNCHPGVTVIWRLMHEGAGAANDTTAQSDGGLLRMYLKIGGMLDYSTRCMEIHEAIRAMRREHRELVYATYVVPGKRDACRGRKHAAELLKITEDDYRDLREEMLDWLDCWLELGPPIAGYQIGMGKRPGTC